MNFLYQFLYNGFFFQMKLDYNVLESRLESKIDDNKVSCVQLILLFTLFLHLTYHLFFLFFHNWYQVHQFTTQVAMT